MTFPLQRISDEEESQLRLYRKIKSAGKYRLFPSPEGDG